MCALLPLWSLSVAQKREPAFFVFFFLLCKNVFICDGDGDCEYISICIYTAMHVYVCAFVYVEFFILALRAAFIYEPRFYCCQLCCMLLLLLLLCSCCVFVSGSCSMATTATTTMEPRNIDCNFCLQRNGNNCACCWSWARASPRLARTKA